MGLCGNVLHYLAGVLLVIKAINGILYRFNNESITSLTRSHPLTVQRLICDFHLLIEADLQDNDVQIRGYDENGDRIIIEIDESKFGKRKNHRGHRVEGVWVLGGVERTNKRKTFLAVVPRRDAQTLTEVHEVVNHSIEFITDEGVYTNTIEGTWLAIERHIVARHRTKLMTPWKLIEFIWRRKHNDNL
ncbi:hypothetical protein INT45_004513 [Circinella minor]|uniref:ISXO2-like transposase domain-containing protein n=1 Tax=Circinella minor TaxID=1195481 RepID=A0A8H7VC45_9FUNG|nr:hypothetical protein INT45_004513 [Circinella minor]